MRRNFDLRAQLKDRRVVVRVVLGTLLAANLVAAVYVFHPWGGSAQDLIEQMHARERELAQQVQQLDRTRSLMAKIQQAKVEGDKFLEQYLLNRRSAFSTVLSEVNKMALESGLKDKGSSWDMEPVEGSDTIAQLGITANYEGGYGSLTKFVNLLDRSPRFLIVHSMQAQPQAGGALSVSIRMDTFIRDAPAGKS
jgi:Tfp pilus assembly protein PilO